MDLSRLRYGIRALALLAIASSVVVGVATAAEAAPINDTKTLKRVCNKVSDAKYYSVQNSGGTAAVCDFPGGTSIVCNDAKKKDRCAYVATNPQRGLVPQKHTFQLPNGVKLTVQTVPDSHVWKQRVSVSTLTDVVCPSLGGQSVASPDGTSGLCSTPTVAIVCKDTSPGTNCLGLADTKKHAKSISKQTEAVVSGNTGSTPSPSSTATTTELPTPTGSTGTRVPPTVRVNPPK
jgi:putative hemolysin